MEVFMSDLSHLHGKHVPGHPELQYWGKNRFIRVRKKASPECRPYLPPPYTGKQELLQALGTNSVPEAVKRSRRVIADFDDMLEHAKAMAADGGEPPVAIASPAYFAQL